MLELITYFLFLTPIYVYIGYPVLLFTLQLFIHRKHQIDNNFTPQVTLIVSCFNEANVIQAKINNCLEIDYPQQNIEYIFVSDGSTDGTDEIIKSNKNIRIIRQEGRLGKTSGLNLAIPKCSSDFIVFSDANAMYKPDAIKKLVRHFSDSKTGYVVGAAIYTDGNQNSAAKSENSYWQYEIALKTWESKLHSVVGGDGAIYAIRKKLYTKLDAKDINDFVNPLQIIAKGYRGIFDAEAICHEETAGDFAKEARRKERIVNRSFRGLMKVHQVLNPFNTGFFSLQILSHKLLRWLIPVFLVGIAIVTIIHAYRGDSFFQSLYFLEMFFLWLAVAGFIKHKRDHSSPILFIPYYFLMVNFYSLLGILKALSGNIQVTWSSPREKSIQQGISTMGKILSAIFIILPFILFLDIITQ
jgi:cellulose synthase/poly-beta-1,6-N-acetylglucosamine synthase-like glycosyltransferase